jgi:hypothetical protein
MNYNFATEVVALFFYMLCKYCETTDVYLFWLKPRPDGNFSLEYSCKVLLDCINFDHIFLVDLIGTVNMKNRLVVLLVISVVLLQTLPLYSQNYSFNGSITREVLDNYLDRAITMQGQSEIEGVQMLTEAQRLDNVAMLKDIGAKFVGRIAGWWANGAGQVNHDSYFAKCSLNVANIKANDAEVICQAAVFEYVNGAVNGFKIPAYVFQAFNLPVLNRNFEYSAMLYPAPASQYRHRNGGAMTDDELAWVPDITRLETQLWFYYMATRYISVGCEAIHFG